MSRSTVSSFVGAGALMLTLVTAMPAQAGPPLLCHPFNIDNAKSLPWSGTRGWMDGRADYNIAKLAADVDALLTPATPVIVRMETMRRAAIYASRDPELAATMAASLLDRAAASARAKKADPLTMLDAAYFVEALRQIGFVNRNGEFADQSPKLKALLASTDGYALVQKGLYLRPQDAAYEFAAALISSDKSRKAYEEHMKRARAGAATDRLLALNITNYPS